MLYASLKTNITDGTVFYGFPLSLIAFTEYQNAILESVERCMCITRENWPTMCLISLACSVTFAEVNYRK